MPSDRQADSDFLLCLAASGGGHLRQLLDLKPFWEDFDHFIVTEDTALGRSLEKAAPTEFIPHFAIGQSRLGNTFAMLSGAARSLWQSLRIVMRRRPDLVLTTGAGSQIFIVLWAKLFGAKVVLIDSFARFRAPSTFARLAAPFADYVFAQSEKAAKALPGARAVKSLKPIGHTGEVKEELVFATVGATLPFKRLCDMVAQAKAEGLLPQEVILQTGTKAEPVEPCEGLTIVETLPFDEIRGILSRAQLVICHGGTGSILTALRNSCHVIVIPRRFELGEHYDNHQAEITESFRDRGLLQQADDIEELRDRLRALPNREVVPVTTDYSELIEELVAIVERHWPGASAAKPS